MEARSESLTRLLADFSLNLGYEDLPPAVITAAERAVADTLACAIAARDEPGPTLLRAHVTRHSARQEATLLGSSQKADLGLAALHNCTLGRDLDANDLYAGPPGRDTGHFSDAIPAVLAAAEAAGSGGRELIVGVVLAYEVQAVLAEAYLWMERSLHSVSQVTWALPPTMGRLLGLDVSQIVSAIGLAGSVGGLILQSWLKPGSDIPMLKGASPGFAAYIASVSVELARQGFTGPDSALDTLFERLPSSCDLAPFQRLVPPYGFTTQRNMQKRYPAQIYLQAAIEAAAQLHVRLEATPLDEVETVVVDGHRGLASGVQASAAAYDPQTRATADHSAPFVIAIALRDGNLSPAAYRDRAWQDGEVRRLMGRTRLRMDPDFDSAFAEHGRFGCRMTVRLRNGRQLSAEVEQQAGHPDMPLSDLDLLEKLTEFVDPELGVGAGGRLLAAAHDLHASRDLLTLIACCRAG